MGSYKLYILIFFILFESSSVFSQNSTCGTNNACSALNETLTSCNGSFVSPLNNSVFYNKIDSNLASCQCNQNFYDNLVTCLTCYNSTIYVTVVSLSEYENLCTNAGVSFSKSNTNVAAGVIIGIIVGIVLLIGLGTLIWFWWRSNRLRPQLVLPEKPGNGNDNDSDTELSTVNLSSKNQESTFSYLVGSKDEDNGLPPSAIRHQESNTQQIATPSSELFYGGITSNLPQSPPPPPPKPQSQSLQPQPQLPLQSPPHLPLQSSPQLLQSPPQLPLQSSQSPPILPQSGQETQFSNISMPVPMPTPGPTPTSPPLQYQHPQYQQQQFLQQQYSQQQRQQYLQQQQQQQHQQPQHQQPQHQQQQHQQQQQPHQQP